METNVDIVYLDHSGFAVDTGRTVLVFDYYRDPSDSMAKILAAGKPLFVFSSHRHGDHFNRTIFQWQDKVSAYILSSDIRPRGGFSGVDNGKLVYMDPYQEKRQGPVQVATFGSTDEGVSFQVEVDGRRLFHAGDLNWWHWKGDTPKNLQLAATAFQREMDRLVGRQFDVAFFPVDSRLEEYRTLGVEEFCRRVKVHQLIAMHSFGEPWTPPQDFTGNGRAAAVWCPDSPGKRLRLELTGL